MFDWEWDVMGNGGNIEDAVRYARQHGIKPMLWYNSGGSHNGVGAGPRDRLLTHESRVKEFTWLKNIGVSGIKIDFFESDKQDMMQYYIDILEDADDYQIAIVFHGCTVPKGWDRTYPHLMTMEAIAGGEQYNNGPEMTERAPRFNSTVPFTRNVVGPMDYTPVAFTNSQYPHKTSFAHELALSVIFESGIQHWADRPEGFYTLPTAARQHMSNVPTAWDHTHFISGYPGIDCLIARRYNATWYVGGINGEDYRKVYPVSFDFLECGKQYMATLLADGEENDCFAISTCIVDASSTLDVRVLGKGGFVIDLSPVENIDLQSLINLSKTTLEEVGEGATIYDPILLTTLQDKVAQAEQALVEGNTGKIIEAYIQLSNALSALESVVMAKEGQAYQVNKAQNVTRHYLGEARNFSRADEPTLGTTRFGLLAEPWVVTPNMLNQDNFTHGGFDSYQGGAFISLEKWVDGLPAIENGKIYQTSMKELPTGTYSLHINVNDVFGMTTGEVLLRVLKGTEFTDAGDNNNVLATYDMSTSGTGPMAVCNFTLTKPTVVTLGFLFNIPQQNLRAMRVSEIRIYNSAQQDVSANYISNYTNIKRADQSYTRFGIPKNWAVENFNVPNGADGSKMGIDKYAGYNELMLGVWDDASRAVGNLSKAKLYKEVTLPAGDYFFGCSYESNINLSHGYIYVADKSLTAIETRYRAKAYLPLSKASTDGKWYGVNFSLTEETPLCLGWNANLTTGAQAEFRVNELALLRYNEVIAEEAPLVGDTILANEMARQGNATNTFNDKQEALLALTNGSEVQIGQVALDDVATVSVFSNTMCPATSEASFALYIDNSLAPLVTCQIPQISSTLPIETKIEIPAMKGVHTLTLQIRGGQCNLWSVALNANTKPMGIIGPKSLSVKGTYQKGIYNLNGQCIESVNGRSLPKGIYVIDGVKSVVR